MSLETWIEQYVGDVGAAAHDPITATEHSIHKWTGMLPGALAEHGVSKVGHHALGDGASILHIDYHTCALCKYTMVDTDADVICEHCPFMEVMGCTCEEDELSPYNVWCIHGDSEPMIDDLHIILHGLITKENLK